MLLYTHCRHCLSLYLFCVCVYIYIYMHTHVYNVTPIFESCVLLSYYAASNGNFSPTFRDNLRSHLVGHTQAWNHQSSKVKGVARTVNTIARIPCNWEVYHSIHNGLPLGPILTQVNQAHALPYYLQSSLIVSSQQLLRFPNGLFPSNFTAKTLYMIPFCPILSTVTIHSHFHPYRLARNGTDYKLGGSSCTRLYAARIKSHLRYKQQEQQSLRSTITLQGGIQIHKWRMVTKRY